MLFATKYHPSHKTDALMCWNVSITCRLFLHFPQQLAHCPSPFCLLPLCVWHCLWTAPRSTQLFGLEFMDPGVSHRKITGEPSSLVTILFYILVEEEMVWILLSLPCGVTKWRRIEIHHVTSCWSHHNSKGNSFLTLLVGDWILYSWRDKHTVEYKN